MEIEVPQYMVEATSVDENTILLNLVVMTSGTMSRYFLCEADQNYQDIAKQLHDKICQAGNEARLAKRSSKIMVVKDLPDGLKNGGGYGKGHIR
jgi:hypothetical protein